MLDRGLKQRLKEEILNACLADSAKSWFLDRTGRYTRLPRRKGEKSFSAQDFLMAVAEGTASAADIPEPVAPQPRPARRKEPQSAVEAS